MITPFGSDLLAQAAWTPALPEGEGETAWLVFGIAAQAAIALGFAIHLIASWRRQKLIIPPAIGYLTLVATLMLLIYAARHHLPVFVVGQFINTIVCLRLLVLIHKARARLRERGGRGGSWEDSGFPVVAPDSAERKLPSDWH